MASLVLSGDTSGSITVSAPAVAGSNTQTLVATTGTLAPVVSGTAQTAPPPIPQYFEFTGIPPWVKRITVMFSGVSTNGTSNLLVQIGAGSVITSGYTSQATAANSGTTSTAGFIATFSIAAAQLRTGIVFMSNITGNTWVESGNLGETANAVVTSLSIGALSLSGTLDRVRITTVNGTDTFDAGTINILYE